MSAIPAPTPRELQILKVLWELGPSSVRDVHRHFVQEIDIHFNTLQTMLRIMVTKGLVNHEQIGRRFIYTATFTREQSNAAATSRFLEDVFDGAASELIHSLLSSEKVSAQELQAMQDMIDQARLKNGESDQEDCA